MDIFKTFYDSQDDENAAKMSAYMKNKFPFLGIPKPIRAKLSKNFLKQKKKDKEVDWEFIFQCYDMPEREFHYLALDYLTAVKALLVSNDIDKIEKLIITNSWWDSVDCIDSIVGHLCLKYPQLKDSVIPKWIDSENIWLKRIAINFQLEYKEKTDTDILSRAILKNCDTGEFFINKAIGWALREYSKTDKEWVKQFIAHNKLHSLSVREASKYL
ncbi:DNA alkylation repair protein [Acetivibrio mesophilus]|uniref:DNA alkylation repair protein n=1 Tax=Acetivibrio mesophilus TaxID=2487273 RepID=A0A4Q0I4T3_9FIRM|nr:DNA alkylation repair protein [Acetivibrio mesophilus]ODM26865.1 DNA alkylation repair protein [Clostridium sp. Bc-iso-3]RXE59271.1 DNA alkylation repair protein [Acetivibrio mesophilus]HHV28343.1 DNA alkylation repair protein [Clostridium sp.]